MFTFIYILVRALQAVADIIRTTLGPRSMLKMLLDANGGKPIRSCLQCVMVIDWRYTNAEKLCSQPA